MNKVAIIGAGDLGSQVLNYTKLSSLHEVVGFFDDFKKVGNSFCGLPILGSLDEIESIYSNNGFDQLFIAIGYKHLAFKKKVFLKFKNKIPFATIVHPSCIVDSSVEIGEGCIIYAGVVLDMNVKIKDNVLINLSSTIAHDTVIGAHSFVSPSVSIAGFVTIGEENIIGINTTVIDSVKTVDNVQTGGGSVVIKDIETSGVYVGSPVRKIK